MKFEKGRIVATSGVHHAMGGSTAFQLFCMQSLERHAKGDWGLVCDEDKGLNDAALVGGERLLSVYVDDHGTKIWIITERDRSATTILFPSEY